MRFRVLWGVLGFWVLWGVLGFRVLLGCFRVRFRVQVPPILVSGLEKSCCRSLFSEVLSTTTMSAGSVSRFFSRNPCTLYRTCGEQHSRLRRLPESVDNLQQRYLWSGGRHQHHSVMCVKQTCDSLSTAMLTLLCTVVYFSLFCIR